MAEKAQYFLEKSVPELKEWEKKGIFTKVSAFEVELEWFGIDKEIG